MEKKLTITRRNLPHWEMDGRSYFITYRCAAGATLPPAARTIVMDNWKFWDKKRYLLHAVIVMNDHVHALITPRRKEDGTCFSLREIIHTNKSFTAHLINKSLHRSGEFWQDERFDRIIRDAEEFQEKLNYMHNNPVTSGMVKRAQDYPWWHHNPHAWLTPRQSPRR